ncbi:hypothetical protein [Alloscardovia venturai]|uniref:hypothetical protein n=1 Tax=Alloscardovia venturai TaxID=1769421 RepID=UPI00366D580A
MNEIAQSRLYFLTSIACVVWLIQSLYKSAQDGTITSLATWIFALCITVVAIYTGIQGWRFHKKAHSQNDRNEQEDEE